jgi:hypothetical protein
LLRLLFFCFAIFSCHLFIEPHGFLYRIGRLTFCPLPKTSSASSAGPDLALSQTAGPEHHPANGWNSINKHRHKQSMSTMGASQLNGGASIGSPSEAAAIGSNRPANVRHSIEGMKLFQDATTAALDAPTTSVVSPPTAHILASPPKLHQSYSANDVPTVKTNGTAGLAGNLNNHAQQHFHNHNASLGRIPAGAMPGRHNRELSSSDASSANGREPAAYPSITSTLQASAAPFGPALTQAQLSSAATPAVSAPAPAMPYPYYAAAHGYNAMAGPPPAAYNALPMLMQNMSVGGGNPQAMYAQQNFTGYNPLYTQPPAPRPHQDSQARVIQNRRQMDSEGKFSLFLFSALLPPVPLP